MLLSQARMLTGMLLLMLSTRGVAQSANVTDYVELKANMTRLVLENEYLLPIMVQLSFHECIGGVCDGCVAGSSLNFGPVVMLADEFRLTYCPQLSRADVHVLMSTAALEYSAKLAGGSIYIPFKVGRNDCDLAHPPAKSNPSPIDTSPLLFLQDNFNVTDKEAVALLGLHTLGRCNRNISGYQGQWDSTPLGLDNHYFINMVGTGWFIQKMVTPMAKFLVSSQWSKIRGQHFSMMLHADMAIYKSFNVSGQFDEPDCEFDDCPFASTAVYVEEFAKSEAAFYETLSIAYTKMLEGDGVGLVTAI